MKNKQKPIIKNFALHKAVKVVRFQAELARLINKKQQDIWSWMHETGVIPAEYVLKIESATRDAGQMVSRHELRPDLYPLDGELPCNKVA